MSHAFGKLDQPAHSRRYLIHLVCAFEAGSESRHYVVKIQPWTSRPNEQAGMCERFFRDEYELVEAVNPLLPYGSDVRDILGHIECSEGFFYVLHLVAEQARNLGWHR
jgi:hypothetical protein